MPPYSMILIVLAVVLFLVSGYLSPDMKDKLKAYGLAALAIALGLR